MSDAKCVRLGYADERGNLTWCGRQGAEAGWCFEDPTHALLTVRNGSHLTICSACAKAMAAALREGEG